MALSFLNRVVWRASSGGTGDFVVASAITGYLVPADALNPAVVDGDTYTYFAQSDDLTQWEIGTGTYDVASTTIFRSNILDSSNAGSIVTFSAAPSVFMGGPLAGYVPGPTSGYVTNPMTSNLDPNGFQFRGADNNAGAGGPVVLQGGEALSGTFDVGGFISAIAGQGDYDGGAVTMFAGRGMTNNGGNLEIIGGLGQVDGGYALVVGGDGITGNGGAASYVAGNGDVDGGDVNFTTGNGTTGDGGDLVFTFGNGAGRNGLFFPNLPSGDPGVTGAAYVDGSGFVKISP